MLAILSMFFRGRWAGIDEPFFLAQMRRVEGTALVSRKASSRAAKVAVSTGRAQTRLMVLAMSCNRLLIVDG